MILVMPMLRSRDAIRKAFSECESVKELDEVVDKLAAITLDERRIRFKELEHRPLTNSDLIRSLTDEELVSQLKFIGNIGSQNDILKWLHKEVDY